MGKMALTLGTFAEILEQLQSLSTSSRQQLLDILERGGADSEGNNPYSLRAIANFLVGVDEYVDGAAELAHELVVVAREAGVTRAKGGTRMARRKNKAEADDELDEEEDIDEEDIDEEDIDEEDIDEEDEKPPRRQARNPRPVAKPKKAPAKKTKKVSKKPAKKNRRSSDRNDPVPIEERIPHVVAALKGAGSEGATINELFHTFSRNKATAKLFPTRRSVKRVIKAHEGEEFERSTPTIWQLRQTRRAAKVAKKKTKPR